MQLFDTHAHLDDETFDRALPDVIARARQAGLVGIVAVGTTAASSEKSIQIAGEYDLVHAAIGIQPNYCREARGGDWDRIVELAAAENVVALGETGLDCYWDYAPLELQRDYFDRHLRLSQELDLPFIVHMRDSGPEIAEMLREARRRGPLRGVMHSFTGDEALAAECLDLGLFISFAGMVTFKKAHDLRTVAAGVPADRLLVETDSPYLSPHPLRGKSPNEPARVEHTLRCLAEVCGLPAEDLAQKTTENARRLFRLR